MRYIVAKGDTLTELASRYGTTVEAILQANSEIHNKDLIYPGATLYIPLTSPVSVPELLRRGRQVLFGR